MPIQRIISFCLHHAQPTDSDTKGQWEKNSILIRLRKLDLDNFPLLKRGFHWVNEFPFNR